MLRSCSLFRWSSCSKKLSMASVSTRFAPRRHPHIGRSPSSVLVYLVEQMAPQEFDAALPGVAPVLALLPAVQFFIVPMDLVVLALDLERLDDLLRHQRHHTLVLAAMQDQQRRLDTLGLVQGGTAPVGSRGLGVVRLAHHPLEIDPTRAVAVPVALRDLRVAIQIDAGEPQRGLLGENAERHVATVRGAVVSQTTVAPRLGPIRRGWPNGTHGRSRWSPGSRLTGRPCPLRRRAGERAASLAAPDGWVRHASGPRRGRASPPPP